MPAANTWSEVQIPLSTLNPNSNTITGITWYDTSGYSQPALYIDDIAFISTESPDAPHLSNGVLFPRSVPADGATTLVVKVKVADPQGLGDVASVTLDASRLGRGSVVLRDDGRSNDEAVSDGVYGAVLTIDPASPPGEQKLLLTAYDQVGHSANLQLGALNVLGAPGGAIPASLPPRIGWGSNAWSEIPGQDWQVNSGVPWDYVYHYITYGWENWGSDFVYRFVHQAWDKQFVPMMVIWMVVETPPNCGENPTCYAQKLQNNTFVEAYVTSLQRAAQQAAGTHPVILNLEPDFLGYMQYLSNDPNNRPVGVRQDDPTSYPVALNRSGYPNTLAGFGRYLVDLIHVNAPNVLVAPMASMWATGKDPQKETADEAVIMGQRTAAFIDAMGGAQSDMLVVEWTVHGDAGMGLDPWWDDQDRDMPRPTRAILWENALSRAAHKRLFLWQMPVGNMSMNNTCGHYQDNRAAYAFAHARDLFDAGVAGVLFGGWDPCMTQVTTDGGFVAAQGGIAYSAPAAPSGLAAGSPVGPVVPLRWNESVEPDLWGYRVVYQLASGSPSFILEVGRRNSTNLIIPSAGAWNIRLQAYDAMGWASSLSSPVSVITAVDAKLIFLPILRR
jgi:hypothetical protein